MLIRALSSITESKPREGVLAFWHALSTASVSCKTGEFIAAEVDHLSLSPFPRAFSVSVPTRRRICGEIRQINGELSLAALVPLPFVIAIARQQRPIRRPTKKKHAEEKVSLNISSRPEREKALSDIAQRYASKEADTRPVRESSVKKNVRSEKDKLVSFEMGHFFSRLAFGVFSSRASAGMAHVTTSRRIAPASRTTILLLEGRLFEMVITLNDSGGAVEHRQPSLRHKFNEDARRREKKNKSDSSDSLVISTENYASFSLAARLTGTLH